MTLGSRTSPGVSSEPSEKLDIPRSPIFIEETSIDIYKAGQSFSVPPDEIADWVVNVSLAIRSSVPFDTLSMMVEFPELGLSNNFAININSHHNSETSPFWVTALWRIPDKLPERWYPHNLGTPKLYNMTITLELESSTSKAADSFVTRTGFRTIQLVQSPYSQQDIEERGITPGDQWHFNINGKPFYVLGTNIIPFDPFYARTSSDQVRWVLESAVKSGQNMVCISVYSIHIRRSFIISLGTSVGWRNISTIRCRYGRWSI